MTLKHSWIYPQSAVLALLAAASGLWAQGSAPNNLANASLEDLMKIDVTSVSRKEQALSKTAAAIFVISREDIRRSGATSIPDLLRMAPGVEVAQINANQWAISIRGFNSVYSNKVLVLIDGRAVYVENFSGVYWDQVDVPLENIERIEVIRGPGGTIWGANAVNGVINMITSSADDTKGGLVVAGSGNGQNAGGLLQYGGDAGSHGAYRVFGKYLNDVNSPLPGGRTNLDGWRTSHFGMRADWALSPRDTFSVQGDFISGIGGEKYSTVTGSPAVMTAVNGLITDRAGDGLARWVHALKNESEVSLQVSDSSFSRVEAGEYAFSNVLDLEFEHHTPFGARHDFVWGLDYRMTHTNLHPTEGSGFEVTPPVRTDHLFALFAQDEIRLGSSVFLTLGTKVEHNVYTGFEYEPGAQLVWVADPRQSLWASASRAIREPDVIERSVQYSLGVVPVPGAGNGALVLEGNPALGAEHLTDYEAGYRSQLNRKLSLDFTGFLSYYRRLVTNEPGIPYLSFSGAEPSLIVPLVPANLGFARDFGAEFFANWQATGKWKISPGFSVLRMSAGIEPGSHDTTIGLIPGESPRQQFELRSLLNVRRNLEWDSSLKYVATLGQNVPAYARLDTRIGWHIGEKVEISVAGQNLAGKPHFEFVDNSGLFTPSEVARTVFGKVTWRY